MSVTTAFANQILALILEGTAIANIADNAASSPLTNLYISLHTADPGASGSQSTSESAYTGYARQAVPRTSSGWTAASGDSDNDSDISFPICTASPGSNLTHVGIGTASSGAGTLLLYGALTTSIVMQVGTTPIFSTDELDVICS
jgi:hypothetical protein